MRRALNVTVENKLVLEQRDLSIYHHGSRSAHILSHNSSVNLRLKTDDEADYIHISVVSGPGNLWNECAINLPAWSNIELNTKSEMTFVHSDGHFLIKLPPGPPTWQLKVSRHEDAPNTRGSSRIVVGDYGKT